MSFVLGLHGTVAVVFLCGLLFIEEAGVPLPFAPGELVLVAGGLLVASGGLNPVVFVPLAVVACVSGSIVGFSWAGLVGPGGLQSLAARIHQGKRLTRVAARVQSAGALGIAGTRLIPGLRIYTTLVAGALRVDRRRFILGMVPASVAWVAVFFALGLLVGLPVAHFFSQVQMLAVQGVILLAIGLGGYFALRHNPGASASGLTRLPHGQRVALAAVIDIGVVLSVVTGVLALARRVLGLGLGAGWFDGAAALLIVALFYIVIARQGAGATVGESLLQARYVSGRKIPFRPRALKRLATGLLAGSPDELRPTADLFRALADPARLRVVSRLADGPKTFGRLSALSGLPEVEVRNAVERLRAVGLLDAKGEDAEETYSVRPAFRAPLLELLTVSREPRLELLTLLPLPAESGDAGDYASL